MTGRLPDSVADVALRAVLDPGSFVKRGPDNEGVAYGEPLIRWQRRALRAALDEVLDVRGRRVYRATATYANGSEVVRHFLTPRARDSWAAARQAGYPADPPAGEYDGRPAIPPATSVEVADSLPVVFP